jgi:protein-S-isoprenylcysteine O-methyltransferase Ste14
VAEWSQIARRIRVPLGFAFAAFYLWIARPTWSSILIGTGVAIPGILLRALASGHVKKNEELTTSGPYAYTRNPLYFGSAILTLGVAIATCSWFSAIVLCGYFALFYSVVMRKEEQELRLQHGAAFDQYAQAVPLFFPQFTSAKLGATNSRSFSLPQYKKNREYRAAIGFLLVLIVLVVIWRLRLS